MKTETCTCDFCGQEYVRTISPKGGRPSFFCKEQPCADAKKFWDAFCKRIDQIKMTDDARKMLRRELMRVVNINLHDNRKRT